MADFYELLGVSRSATADEIKRAYRRRARELHPDANPNDPAAEERFKELARAYEVLADPDQRARYDRYGEAGVGAASSDAFFGAGGIGDIFDAFFGGASPFGAQRGPSGPPRGQDLEVVADIAFEASIFGGTVPVTVRTAVVCEECGGRGAAPGTTPITCNECGGLGQVRRVRQSVFGQMVTAGPCRRCGGSGQIVSTPCPRCRGETRVVDDRTYNVDVPAGVDTGSTLRLAGRGAAGPHGGAAGDLYVHVRVAASDRFVRDGYDLVADLPISVAQAALGTHLQLDAPDGTIDVAVPAGTQSGREFRARRRGIPHVDGRGRGDLRIVARVETPTDLSATEQELLRRLAEERGETVDPPASGVFSRIRSAFK
jgi:molecular chaperone DnaJ